MFRSLSSKGNGSSSSSKNKKTDASSSSRKRAESIVSSSSNRKASRAEERSSEPYTTPTSSSQYTYPAMNGSSGPSSYVTAPDSRMNDRYEYSAPARPASLTENAIRALSTEDGAWEDMDARSDQRSRVSGDHKKRHKKNRSRSDSRDRSARKDKRDRSDKPSESSRAKRRPEDSIVRERALDSPRESSRGYDTFSAQVGAASFSQFPGQYNEPLVGPPSSYQRPDMSSHVQDQFPGQDPIQYATSAFRPGKTVEEGGFGLAADFYNDQGQSVSGQPGIRPESATIITGTQPHLMTASALPAPPVETGNGSAAEFYSAASAYTSVPPGSGIANNPTNTASPAAPTPSRPPKVTKPGKLSSSSAALASGAAGAALGYATSNLHQQSQSSHQQTSSMSSYPPSINTPLNGQAFTPNQHYHSTSEPFIPTNSSFHDPPAINRPPKPGKSSSQPQSSLYAAAGASGLAAGAYGLHEYHNHQAHHHQSAFQNNTASQPASFYGRPSPLPYMNGTMSMKHQHRGPVSKFVDWWKDHEDVRKMEEYTEFIGVCRYCFDPRTSVADAPRKHNYDRRRSSDSLRRRSNDSLRKTYSHGSKHSRVDKDSRYYSSDNERRRKKSSWLGAGLAGYGIAKIGGALWQNSKDFDDTYSIRSGRRNGSSSVGTRTNRSRSHSADRRSRSERGVVRGQHDHEFVYVRTKDGNVVKQRVPPNRSRSRSRSRSHSRSRRDGLLGAAALGAVAGRAARGHSREKSPHGAFVRSSSRTRGQPSRGAFVRRTERSRSRSHSPGLGEILGLTGSGSGRDKRDPRVVPHLNTSRTSARQSGGMFGGFFSSQPEKKRKEHHKKKKGFFSFSNSSSSSSNSDLAFGNGFTTQRQKNRKDNKTKSDEHLNATLLGIGTTAAALAVARGGKKQSQRMPEVVAVRQRKGRKSHHDQRFGRENSREDEDGWESTSDFDEDASVSSGLAFGDFGSSGRGPARHSSMDSLTSQSSGTDKWGWRWGSKPDKKSKPPPQAYSGPAQYNTTSPGMPVGLNDTFYGPPPDPRLRRHPESATSSPISTNPMQPMRYVDPVPTSDFDASRHSSIPGAFPSQSPITARPAPVPIQQPQPITPVQPSLYTSQGIVQPPSSTSGGSAKYSQLPPSAGLRRTQSSPITSHFSRDAALAGVAAAATASILSNGRKSTKEDSPSNVRFELTDKQVRKEERERRREQDKGGARREEREQILTNEALEREQNQRRAAERQVAEDAVRREANAIRELAERAEAERRKEMERQRFEQEALARRKADIDAEAERLRDAERRKYEIATMMAGPAQREADESQNFGRSDQPVGSKYPREVSDKPDNWSQQRRHDVDNEQHRIYLEEHEDHPDSSKRAPPIMAGIAGATVGAVLAGAKHKGQSDQHERVVYEARPSDDRNGELEDDIYDPDFFRRKRSESDLTKHADIARKAAAKVVSDLEDRYRDPPPSQANFFAPKELSEPAKGKTKATDPIGDNDVQVYHVPGISLNEPPPPYQPSPDFLAKDKDKKSGRMPWNVPKLNVIAPTPPTSHAGSIKGDRSPISPVEDPQNYDEHGQRDSSLERRKANRVSWGEDQTRVFEVHTPESARDQFMSSQDLEDTQNQKRDEIVVETDEHDEQPQKTTYKAKELPKTTNEPAQSVHNETPSGNDRFYQRPFFESVSDLGLAMDSPGTEGAPPVRGFVEGEVDEPTPAEERLPHIPGGFDDEISTPPVESPFEASSSKKEKKKKGKAGKRASLEDSFFPPTVDMEQIQAEPEPEFEVPLSKKEKKKREKAAKRGLTDDPLPSPPVEIEARQEEVFDDGFEVPLSKKEQKKRAQDVGSGLADLESSSSFPAINDESRPDSQSADLPPDGQDYFLSKKEKKKRDKAARRGLDEYDSAPSSAVEPETASPVAEVAVELEPAEDDYFLSKKDKKKREKAAKRALLEEEVVPDIPPAELEEPAEQVDDFEIPLSKKEKKRRDKLAKQTSLDDNSLPSTPVEELSAIQLADDDFDYPLTAKEKKKRAKEAKRLGLDSTATAVLAGGAIGAALADLDTTHSYNNLERDPRDVEPELKAGPPRDVGGSEGRRASVPEFGLDEPDILADAKKLKKKSKRNSGAFNSPTVGSPLRSEIAWDDYVGSQVRGTSNEDQHHHHQGLDQAKDSEKEQFKDRYFEDRPMQQEPVNESNDRRTTDLASPESDRDARSVVSAPTGYDENSARHKSRRSRHENDDYETSGRSRSVAASEPADVYESSKKHKRRSKRDGEDFDDTASVTSARSSRSKYDEEDSSKSKKDKKGGILGLFRRKSSDSTSKSQGPDELDNELDEDKKHKKRHHRRKSSERDPYDDAASTTSSSRRQDEDVDDDARSHRSSSSKHRHRHRDDSGDDFDDTRSQVSESKRKHKHRHRDRSVDDDKSRSRDRKDANEYQYEERDQSFLAGRVEDEELPPLPASSPSSPTRAPESVDQHNISPSYTTNLPEVTAETNDHVTQSDTDQTVLSHSTGSINEAFMPLPESRPSSPIEVGSVENLPPLPASRPTSPFLHDETPKRPLIPLRPSSSTAIPLRFRRPPISPGLPRERSLSFNSPTAQSPVSPVSSPRTRQGRPSSTEFRHSTEFRPLYLVERNSKPQEAEQEEQLPSLPSSRTTSRASSFRGSEEYQSAAEDWASEQGDRNLSIFTALDTPHEEAEDVLGSQQTTPKASNFPQHVLNGRAHAEAEYYSWEDIEREEELHEKEIPEHPRFEAFGAQPRSENPKIIEEETQLANLSQETSGIRSLLQHDNDENDKRSSFDTAATAALTSAAIGLLTHEATNINDDPMSSDVWGDESDRGDDGPSYFDAAESDLLEKPIEPVRPTLSRASSSKKGKKGKKGKEIKLGTASISGPSTPIEVSPEELRNRRRRDTQDAVESWFEPATVDKYEKKKQGKKGKSQQEDLPNDRPDHAASASAATDETSASTVDKAAPDVLPDRNSSIEAAQVTLPETPPGTTQGETNRQLGEPHAIEVALPESPAFSSESLTASLKQPESTKPDNFQSTNAPETAVQPAKVQSDDYFPIVSRKKSKTGKKKQKYDSWDESTPEINEVGPEIRSNAALDISTEHMTSSDDVPTYMISPGPLADVKTDFSEQFPKEPPESAEAAIGSSNVSDREVYKTITDAVEEEKQPGYSFQTVSLAKSERKKKGKKGKKVDPWADDPPESPALSNAEPSTPVLEVTQQTLEAQPEFFQPAKKGKKGKKKQKDDPWTDEPVMTVSSAEQPLADSADSGLSLEAEPRNDRLAEGNDDLRPELIELPQGSDENLAEPVTATAPAENITTSEKIRENTKSLLQTSQSETAPEDLPLPETTDQDIDDPAVTTETSPDQLQSGTSQRLESESIATENIDEPHSAEVTTPAQEQGSSWLSWLPGSKKKKGKKAKGTPTTQSSSIDLSTALPKSVGASQEDSHLPIVGDMNRATQGLVLDNQISYVQDLTKTMNDDAKAAGSPTDTTHDEGLPNDALLETADRGRSEGINQLLVSEAISPRVEENQSTSAGLPLGSGDPDDDKLPAANADPEQTAEDEWAYTPIKKGKKAKKGKTNQALINPEPLNGPNELEKHVRPMSQDVSSVEGKVSLDPANIALPSDELLTETTPEDIPVPSEEQVAIPDQDDVTATETARPQEIRQLSQVTEPELESQEDFWAPTKKTKKGKKAKRGLDSPAEPTSQEISQPEGISAQQIPHSEQSEAVETEDLWSMSTKKGKKGKKGKKIADLDDALGQERKEIVKPTPEEIQLSSQQEDLEEKNPAIQESVNTLTQPETPQADDEWALPLSKKSKKARKGKISALGNTQVVEDPVSPFVTSTTVTEPVNPTQEVVEEKGANREPDVTAATLDDMAEGGNDLRANLTEEVRDGTETKKLVLEELDRDVSQDKELEPQTEKAPPQELVPDEAMKVLSQEQDIWATPKAKKGKKGRRGPVDLQEESLQPIMPEATTKTSDEAKLDDQNVSTQDQNNQTTVPTNCEDKSPTDLLPDNGTYTSDNVINQTDDSMEPEDVFATPIADRQITFETPMTETPDIFMTPFEPHTPVPATHPGNVNLRIRSTPPSATRRTSYFGQGASYIDPIISETTAEDSAAALLASTVPLPGDDFTPNPSINEHVQDSKKPSSSPNPIKNDDLLEDAAQVPIEESATKEGETVHESNAVSLDALRDDNQTDEALRQHDPDKAQSKPDHDLPPKPELDPADAAQDEAWPLFPVKQSKKDKKKAKKAKTQEQEPIDTVADGSQAPLEDPADHLQPKNDDIEPYEPTEKPTEKSTVDEPILPAKLSKKGKKKAEKSTSTWSDSWMPEGPQEPTPEALPLETVDSRQAEESIASADSTAGQHDATVKPIQEDMFVLPSKRSKKDKKKANKADLWEEDTWSAEQPDTSPMHPVDVPISDTEILPEPDTKEQADFELTETTETHNSEEEAKSTLPSKPSKKDKKKAKKAMTWNEPSLSEPEEILPGKESNEKATSEVLDELVEGQTMSGDARGETSEMPTEDTGFPQPVKLSKKDKKKAKKAKAWEEWPAEISQDKSIEEASQESSAASMIPEDETLQTVLDTAKKTPLPEIEEAEVLAKLSKKDKKKAKKLKADEETLGEAIEEIPQQATATSAASTIEALKTIQDVAEETPLPGEEEDELPATLSKKDKKKARKARAWEDWPTEETQGQPTVETPQDDTAIGQEIGETLTTTKPLSDDHGETTREIAEETALPEEKPDALAKPSKKDKKKGKKVKAWEEWPTDETREGATEELPQDIPASQEGPREALTLGTLSLKNGVETVQELAEDIPLADEQPEALPKLSKKDKKKAKKSKAWEDPWPSEETQENKEIDQEIGQAISDPNAQPTSLNDDFGTVQKEETTLPDPNLATSAKQTKKEKRKAKKGKSLAWDDVEESVDESGTTTPVTTQQQVGPIATQDTRTDGAHDSDNNQFHPVTNTIEAPDLAVSKMPEPDPEGSLMPASASKKSKKDKKKAKKNTYTWDEAESVPQSPAVEDPVRQTNTAEDASAGNIHETMSIHDQSGDFKVPDPSVQPDERGASPKKLQDSSEEIDRPAELQGEQRTACDREIDTLPINEQAQQQTPGIEESESPRQDIDFAATLAAGLENSGFDPNLVVNDPIFHRRASPPGQAEADPEEFFITKKNRKGKKDKLTKAVESQESQESTPIEDTAKSLAGRSEPEISNEKDTKDGGFSAALTAGLAAAGFASNILQGSSSDHDAITEEPEEFSFAIPKRKKGKKGNKSLPLTPDMGEQTKDSIPENPDISVGAAVDEAPVGSSKFEAPAIPDPEPLGLIPEQSAQLEESTLLPHPAEIGVAAVVPHTTLDSEEPADAPAESSREISEPAAEEEFALASKKKGKKGKKKGVAWQLTEDEPAEEAAGATTADTGLTNESAGLFQTPWLKDMMPGSSLPTPDQQEIAPIAIQEAPKDTSPEDKFMEEAFTGFSSKKRKGKKDKKSKIAPENTDIEEKLNEEAKQEIGEETKAGEQVQSIHVNDVLDPQPATETRALKDTTLQDVPQPEFGTSQQTAEEKSPIALSSEDAISPTSKIANIFPGLQRVKRRTTSTASHEQNKPRQESLGELTESEPGSTSSRLPPIETKDTGASSNRASSTISDYRQSGTFTPIDMDTPVENDQAKTAASNDHSVEEGERRAKTILSDEPSWSFDNLRDSGVPSLDSPVSPETPYKRDTVRDSGYNDDSEAQISSDNKNKQPRSERTRSPEDPIRVSIELNPDWSLPVAKQRSARKKGKLDDRTISESIKEEGTHSTSSPPSPVESTTKDRTSYLFSSPPDVERGGAAGSRHAAASPVNRSIPEVAGRDDRMDYFAPTPEEAIRQPTSPATVLLGGTTPAYSEHTTPAYSEHAPPARKKSRDISDVGSPEQGVKSARRTATPLQSFRERMNTLASQEAHPEVKSNLRNDVGSQWSLSGREEEQAGDNGGDLRIDTRRGLEDLRSGSASSNRPTSSGSHSMRPYDQIRSSSAASNRSTTPSLRRVDRSVSGDLRAASRASRRGDPRDAPGPKTITIEPPPTPPLQEEDENAFNGPGNARTPDMSNVYEGWGDVRGSSMSPTRPPSVRKRQSMHISDLQTQLDALVAENRQLQEANNNVEQSHRNISQQFDAEGQAFQVELEERDEQLREKDAEVQQLREMLEPLQQEIARLTEINADLTETKRNLLADTNNRYASIQREHSQTRQQWKESHRELESLRQQHNELTVGMEDIVRKEIAIAMQDRNAEIRRLREELETATQQIRALQSQILSSKTEDFLSAHDEDYFDTACQKLCQHVQQWVLRFSKYSDNRMCRLTSDLADEKIEARLDNTILDGSDVDKLLGDRIRRRDVFMSLVMSMIWEYVFTRYLFGMDREQRQKLKALEKILLEVGPTRAVAHWRATTLTLLSRRPAFATQRNLDTEAVAQEIFSVLSTLLPPPSQMETQILTSLRNVLRLAVDLSIEMRTQRAEYIMLPPLQPEYDTHGDLVRKVHFNAALMNERSGEHSSNDELERNMSVVKMVLFPLVVKKGNDEGEGEDEIVVCPAQVLVAGSKLGKKVVRVLSGAMEIDEPRRSKQSLLSGMDGGSANMI